MLEGIERDCTGLLPVEGYRGRSPRFPALGNTTSGIVVLLDPTEQSRSGLGELVAAQGLTGRPDRIQRIGLGAVAAGGSLGPVQLHHVLAMSLEEAG
jgi:hypothetical protein